MYVLFVAKIWKLLKVLSNPAEPFKSWKMLMNAYKTVSFTLIFVQIFDEKVIKRLSC